jgi:hypothetical protein
MMKEDDAFLDRCQFCITSVFLSEFLNLINAPKTSLCWNNAHNVTQQFNIQGVFESCAEILTTSYWLHVELGKNI